MNEGFYGSLTNNPDLQFKSLVDEKYRVYEFPNGVDVKIEMPIALNVSPSGGHRVYDNKGISHYIPSGWIHLYWEVHEGMYPFAF